MPATAQIRIGADTKEFKRAMDGINGQLGKIGNSAKGLSSILGGTLGMLKKIGGATVFGGIPAGLLAAQRAFNKFEHNMLEVYTLLPKANRAFFQTMKKDALSFSEAYGRMPEEVAKGMYQAISAGNAPKGLTDGFLAVAQKSAIAGVTDMKTAVDALTNVTNSYGAGTYDVAQVADQMFTAVSMSKTTFRELADYMYQILPTASSLNVRLDDLLGSISALAATGTLTRVGTTQLRQMMIEMSRIGDKSQQAFISGTGGVPLEEFIKRGGRLVDVIKIMAQVAERRKVSIRNLFGSVEAGNAAITLSNSKKFMNMVDTIEHGSGGMMGLAFDKMASSQKIRIDKIARTFMNSFIKVGEVIRPMIDDIITYFEGRAKAIQEFDWEGLATKFKDVWFKIKKIIGSGSGWEFFVLHAKIALKKVILGIRKVMDYWSAQLAIILSGGSSGWGKMSSALMEIASAFWDKFATGARDAGVVLLNAFQPALAFIKAGLQQVVYEMNPLNKKTGANQVSTARRDQIKSAMEEKGWNLKELLNNKLASRQARKARHDMMRKDPKNIGNMFGVERSQSLGQYALAERVHMGEGFAPHGAYKPTGWDIFRDRGFSQKDLESFYGKKGDFSGEGIMSDNDGISTWGWGKGAVGPSVGLAEGVGSDKWDKFMRELVDITNDPSVGIEGRQWAGDLHKEMIELYLAKIEGMQIAGSTGMLDHINPEFSLILDELNARNLVLMKNYKKNMFEYQGTINTLTKWRDKARPEEQRKNEEKLTKAIADYKVAQKELSAEIKHLRENGLPAKSDETRRLEASIKAQEARVADLWNAFQRPRDEEEGVPDDGGNIVEEGEAIGNNDRIIQAIQKVPMVADSKQRVGGGGGVWTGRYTPLDKNNDLLDENIEATKKNTEALNGGRTNSVLDGIRNNPPLTDHNFWGETQSRANFRASEKAFKESAEIKDELMGTSLRELYDPLNDSLKVFTKWNGEIFQKPEMNNENGGFPIANPTHGELNPYNWVHGAWNEEKQWFDPKIGEANPEFDPKSRLPSLQREFLERIADAGGAATGRKMTHQEVFAASDAEYLYVQEWNEMVAGFQRLYVEQMAAAKELRIGTEEYRAAQQEALKLYPRVTVDEVLNFQ